MLLIAGKDLRLRVRDRSVFIIGVIVPFVLALVFSLILGDAGDSPIALSFAVVDEDESSVTARFVDALEGISADGLAELTILDDESAARSGVTDGDFGAAFVLPAGFGASVEAGSTASVTVLGNVDSPTSVAIAQAIAETFGANIEGVRLVAATAVREGADVGSAITAAQSGPPALALSAVEAADRQLDLSTFFVAGMAVFFLFFTVQFGVTSLLEEKREGTMARLLAAPIDRWTIVGAKAMVSFVLGIVSMTVLIVASTLLLGAEWGNPGAVALLVISGVVSALGIMAVVAAFARTPEGAGNLQSVIAVGLGMLGGIFFPTPLGDGVLSWLAMLTPHRWFMTGLADLAGGGGIPVVLPSVAALLAFGLVTGGLAGIRLRRGVLA